MIQKLSIKGLNDQIDADLVFNSDLNIITGKNGSGKTTLLKLLWYLISGNLERVVPEIPFKSVSIEADEFFLSITQGDSDEISLVWKFPGEEEDKATRPFERSDRILNRLNRQIARATGTSLFFPTFRRIEGGFYGRGTVSVSDSSLSSISKDFHLVVLGGGLQTGLRTDFKRQWLSFRQVYQYLTINL